MFCTKYYIFLFQGDLKQFLVATRKSSVRVIGNKQRPPPLTLQQSLRIVQQAASALDHLTQSQFVHKDIAARNCLITSSLNVKLTFSSLCKDTYAMEYYEIRDRVRTIDYTLYTFIMRSRTAYL